ncbi:MAG: Holliday junction branch migration protein RuvA [Clostridia bacterium]|nr:Holliday junction branch migration protein RuvA [Clostridia bacterium]MBQ8792086.1 Holliday junction branch migration protein RuvA [Clostridia bacterium]
MISFLVGIVDEKADNILYLDVNGVGFELNVSTTTLGSLPMQGSTVKVYTYMAVREDDISLYGFSTMEEKNLFNSLISVSGIGPKMAIQILSGLNPSDLIVAIINADYKLLSKVKGLGKKTAERLCLELKDKLSPLPGSAMQTSFDNNFDEDAVQMATDTLIALGINKNEAYMLARSNAINNASAEEIISKALRGYKG